MNEQYWEQFLHIKTNGDQALFPTDISIHRYEATPYSDFELLFDHFEFQTNAYVIDFGCGKGRLNFFLAAKNIPNHGVEIDRYLLTTAQQNKNNFAKHFIIHPTFSCEWAQSYDIQQHMNTFYFFNPFDLRTFQQVITNIIHSYWLNIRQIELTLYYPSTTYENFLDDCTPFEKQKIIRCSQTNSRHCFLIYSLAA